ncbi:MAG: DNA-3-methyladenine glycosylase family protein [Hyphomicrobiales bacterium]
MLVSGAHKMAILCAVLSVKPAMNSIDTIADLEEGIYALRKAAPEFVKIHEATGTPPLRRAEGGFAGLLRIIAGQQVSKASAAAIWKRMCEVLAPLEPEHFARLGETDYRSAGLSGPKIRAIEAVTEAVLASELDFADLHSSSDENAAAKLMAVKGIGPWSAEIYLLACLGRPDIWPAGDLALQVAAADIDGEGERLSIAQMQTIAEPWRPWRAVAARLLWSWYAQMRNTDPGVM